MKTPFKVGDQIIVVGNPCSVVSCIGLIGYVDKVYECRELRAEVAELSQRVCDECDGSGWKENAVEKEYERARSETKICQTPLKNTQ